MENLNKKKLLSILEQIVREESTPKTPINKFVYFSFNFPPNFIQEIWGENNTISDHLNNKFSNIYSKVGANAVMSRFYVELDMENQKMLEDYIMNNYRG